MNKQIKITLTEENYNRLKQSAKENYRTISQEVNYRLNSILGTPSTPSPVYIPHDLNDLKDAPGIPKTPYKIIAQNNKDRG